MRVAATSAGFSESRFLLFLKMKGRVSLAQWHNFRLVHNNKENRSIVKNEENDSQIAFSVLMGYVCVRACVSLCFPGHIFISQLINMFLEHHEL